MTLRNCGSCGRVLNLAAPGEEADDGAGAAMSGVPQDAPVPLQPGPAVRALYQGCPCGPATAGTWQAGLAMGLAAYARGAGPRGPRRGSGGVQGSVRPFPVPA